MKCNEQTESDTEAQKRRENAIERREASETLLIGYDSESLQIALQRLYVLECVYRDDIDASVPSWLIEARLLLEEILGKNHDLTEVDR